jgi:hypothetical protein
MVDDYTRELFKPLVDAMGKENEAKAWEIIEAEAEGVLAWGVRSGYLLWTRSNPGKQPSKEQMAGWTVKGRSMNSGS